jgi:hypothetical protein
MRWTPTLATIAACAATCAAFCTSLPALAQDLTRTPLPDRHPLIGAWRFDVPGTECHEVYTLRADGTTTVTSGEEVSESEFELDALPSAKGYYKWVDKIVKDNGKPDCMGSVMQVGHTATNFILLHPVRKEFLMCEKEEFATCFGPFKRLGSDI